MRAHFKAHLLVLVSIATALTTSIEPSAGDPAAIAKQTTGGPFMYEVVAGDSLVSLGARYGIDPQEIAGANGLQAGGAIAPDVTLRLDNRHIVPVTEDEADLVINIPQRMLFFAASEGPLGFPVGLGRRDWPTPDGEFTVLAKEENPTWDVPASIQAEMRRQGRSVVQQVPPGPTNPLGAFWLGLSFGAVGIHGTNAPLSVFRHVTHGCVRMHPDDIARLYPLVSVGTQGRIVYEPVLLAQTPDGIFLEAHPDVYRRMTSDALSFVRQRAVEAGISAEIDWTQAGRVLKARRGIASSIRLVTLTDH